MAKSWKNWFSGQVDTAPVNARSSWLQQIVKRLERIDQYMSFPQKQCLLVCFFLAVGTYFMHLVVAGITTSTVEFREQHRSHQPPRILAAPLPPVSDSIPNSKLLP